MGAQQRDGEIERIAKNIFALGIAFARMKWCRTYDASHEPIAPIHTCTMPRFCRNAIENVYPAGTRPATSYMRAAMGAFARVCVHMCVLVCLCAIGFGVTALLAAKTDLT